MRWKVLWGLARQNKGFCLKSRGAGAPDDLRRGQPAALLAPPPGLPDGENVRPSGASGRYLILSFFRDRFWYLFRRFDFPRNGAADSGIFFALPVAGVFRIGAAAAANSRALGAFRGYGVFPILAAIRIACSRFLLQPNQPVSADRWRVKPRPVRCPLSASTVRPVALPVVGWCPGAWLRRCPCGALWALWRCLCRGGAVSWRRGSVLCAVLWAAPC